MNINDMYKEVCITLDKSVGRNEFNSCLNTIIRRLNAEAQKPIELVTITGTAGDDYEDITDDWEDITEDWDSQLRFLDGIEWDTVNYAITLPRDYNKVLSVFCDDEKMQATSYDILQSETGTAYYTTIGNTIYFGTDLQSADYEIKVRAKCDYPTYIGSADYTGLSEHAYSMLINGILFMLCTRPRYRDELGLTLYKSLFENNLASYNLKVLEQDLKSIDETPFYTSWEGI